MSWWEMIIIGMVGAIPMHIAGAQLGWPKLTTFALGFLTGWWAILLSTLVESVK